VVQIPPAHFAIATIPDPIFDTLTGVTYEQVE
jgi:hypothetical protein